MSDPVVPYGRAIAQRIKATLGIRLISPRVHIDGEVRHLVSTRRILGAVVGPKGWAVRPLKRRGWVQIVNGFGRRRHEI